MADNQFQRLTGLAESELDDVLALVAGTDVVELEIRYGRGHVLLRRQPPDATHPPGAPPAAATGQPVDARRAITSPLVGIFHLSVGVQQQVEAGQALGAIEAMGMPTSIDSPRRGIVEEVLVTDGSPVEFGQPLLVLRPSRDGIEAPR